MDDKIIEIKNLTVEYHTDDDIVYAVNDISLELKKGESLGLVGETGAGKTTIAKSVLGILPKVQSKIKSGEIILREDEYKKRVERILKLRSKINYEK